MKRYTLLSLLCIFAFVSCNNTPEEQEEKITYTKLTIASECSYMVGEHYSVWWEYIIRETDNEASEWETHPILGGFEYERGYEYTVLAHKEVVNPESKPEKHILWWYVDEVLEKVEKDSEIPEDIYIYTYGSPWGLDPRDPFLDWLMENFYDIFGEDAEIYYPTKY